MASEDLHSGRIGVLCVSASFHWLLLFESLLTVSVSSAFAHSLLGTETGHWVWSGTGESDHKVDLSKPPDEVARLLGEAHGSFAAGTAAPGHIRVWVDAVRSIPLFYGFRGADGAVGTDPVWVQRQIGACGPSATGASDLRNVGVVLGTDTLLRGVSQVPAGTTLELKTVAGQAAASLHSYDAFTPSVSAEDRLDLWISRVDLCLEKCLERLLHRVGRRRVVLPLSGGLDSRVLAFKLCQMGAPPAATFTYGTAGNDEAQVSHAVARALSLDWEFAPYTSERWKQAMGDPRFGEYVATAGRATGVPHVQDWPAVHDLGLGPDDVVVPGHSADLLAGSRSEKSSSFVYDRTRTPTREVACAIATLHRLDPSAPMDASVLARIRALLPQQDVLDRRDAVAALESWERRERQAKFIVNSVRAYESVGAAWGGGGGGGGPSILGSRVHPLLADCAAELAARTRTLAGVCRVPPERRRWHPGIRIGSQPPLAFGNARTVGSPRRTASRAVYSNPVEARSLEGDGPVGLVSSLA